MWLDLFLEDKIVQQGKSSYSNKLPYATGVYFLLTIWCSGWQVAMGGWLMDRGTLHPMVQPWLRKALESQESMWRVSACFRTVLGLQGIGHFSWCKRVAWPYLMLLSVVQSGAAPFQQQCCAMEGTALSSLMEANVVLVHNPLRGFQV